MSLPDGLYPDMTREEYDAIARPSWSEIKPLGRSVAHFFAALNGKRSTPALSMGSAADCAALEPHIFKTLPVYDGVRRGKEWEAFKATHAGQTILTRDEHDTAEAMAEVLRRDPHASRHLSGGKSQVTVLWTVDGIGIKSRLDYLNGSVVEYKTTVDASPGPRGFGSQVARYDYLGQAAAYVDAIAQAGERKRHVFIAQEKEPPYVCQVYLTPAADLLVGRQRYRELLEKWVACRALATPPTSYANGELELELPAWAFGDGG